jgi:hypothetical protein
MQPTGPKGYPADDCSDHSSGSLNYTKLTVADCPRDPQLGRTPDPGVSPVYQLAGFSFT